MKCVGIFPVGQYELIIVIIIVILGLFVLCGQTFSGWSYVGLRHNRVASICGLCRKTKHFNELGDGAHPESAVGPLGNHFIL